MNAGFTLIELLVVVLIIGIIATFLSLSIGQRSLDDQLDHEAQRLFQILQLAADEAEAQGIELGFLYTQQGYEFLTQGDNQKWVPYAVPGPLRIHQLTEPFTLELSVEGRRVTPALPQNERKPGAALEPQVLLLSSGERTAFTLDVRAPRHPRFQRITAPVLGTLTMEAKS